MLNLPGTAFGSGLSVIRVIRVSIPGSLMMWSHCHQTLAPASTTSPINPRFRRQSRMSSHGSFDSIADRSGGRTFSIAEASRPTSKSKRESLIGSALRPGRAASPAGSASRAGMGVPSISTGITSLPCSSAAAISVFTKSCG